MIKLPIIAALALACFSSNAQNIDFAAIPIQTVKIADGIYVLMGGPAQGNILVSTGPDGIFLIDSMYAPMHQKIMDALAAISNQPIRFLVNTHLHGDHTAGNEAMAKLGAVIVSHENMRKRMAAQPNTPTAALPVVTYADSMTLHFNGEEIYIYHPAPAHTDGDSVVYFRHANVMHVGDVPSSLRYPNIGVNEGGSVDGMIAAARQVMTVANENTKIIPGHLGPVVGFKEIRQQLVMFTAVRDRIASAIRAGRTLEQVVASKPTADFDQGRMGGAITPDRFVTLVYTDLSRKVNYQAPVPLAVALCRRHFGHVFSVDGVSRERLTPTRSIWCNTITLRRQAKKMRYPIPLTIVLVFVLLVFPGGSAQAQLAQPPAGVTEGVLKEQPNACPANSPLGRLEASPAWSGWGGANNATNNARFQTKANAGLASTDVPKLKLKWSFGVPGATSMYSQPAVAFGRVFVGGGNGVVYSLDAKSGCLYWAYQADMFGRFAPIAASISGHPGTRYAILFATRSTTAYALDAQDGKLLWKTQIRTGLNNLSATAAFHDGRLYVPMSGTETLVGADPNYECCKSRGAVAALDANTGKVLWVTQSVQEPLRELGENAKGKQRWGPAGASVWNTPTVDARRGLIYAGTGNSFGRIAAATSDSILALRMKDGRMMWHHQEFEGDAFMARCQATNPADSNCAEKLGPDYDFGGSSAILQTVNGRDILLAAGKGGVAIALDPDHEGKLLWRTQLWETQAPSASGLVVWGGAADGTRVYYPLQQPGGGLKALDIKSGKVEWNAAIGADRRGQAGPASAIPGAVFTGGWDGILRAVSTSAGADGKVIWSFNAVRDFSTVNGVPAKGGSFGSAGPVIAGGMLFAASGYPGTLRGTPGNVLLAFGVE